MDRDATACCRRCEHSGLPELFTAAQIAEYLQVDEALVARLIRRREIGVVKIAGRSWIRGSDVEAFLDAHAIPPGGEASPATRRVDEGRRKVPIKDPSQRGRPMESNPAFAWAFTAPTPDTSARGASRGKGQP